MAVPHWSSHCQTDRAFEASEAVSTMRSTVITTRDPSEPRIGFARRARSVLIVALQHYSATLSRDVCPIPNGSVARMARREPKGTIN